MKGLTLLGVATVAAAAGWSGAALAGALGTPKAPKCRANACAYFNASGNPLAVYSHVVGVTKTGTGRYCVELDPKIDASKAYPQLTVDYSNSPGTHNSAQYNDTCGENGVGIVSTTNDSGTAVEKDAAIIFTIP